MVSQACLMKLYVTEVFGSRALMCLNASLIVLILAIVFTPFNCFVDNCKNERIIQTANIHGNNCKRKNFIFLERKTIINPRKIYNKSKLFPKSIEWGRAERLFPTDHPSGKAYAVKEKGTEGKILLKIKKHLQIEKYNS